MTKQAQVTEWVTVQDVAQMLGMSRHWVVDQIKAGKLRANRLGGGRNPAWRIDAQEADRFAKSFAYKPKPQTLSA